MSFKIQIKESLVWVLEKIKIKELFILSIWKITKSKSLQFWLFQKLEGASRFHEITMKEPIVFDFFIKLGTMLVHQNWVFHVLIPWLWTLKTTPIPKGVLVQFLILTTQHWFFSKCRFSTWTTFASYIDLRDWIFFKIIWNIVHWSIGIKFSYLFKLCVLQFSCPNVNNN